MKKKKRKRGKKERKEKKRKNEKRDEKRERERAYLGAWFLEEEVGHALPVPHHGVTFDQGIHQVRTVFV